jgi:hypothetical protein
MRDLSIKLGIGVFLLILLGAVPATAQRFALTCVGTETDDEVNFQYRWGKSDSWTQVSVEPGKWQMLTYKYDYAGENSSPQLQIRYDDDLSDDSNFVISDLDSYAAKNRYCEGEGKTYNFHQRGLELYIVEED